MMSPSRGCRSIILATWACLASGVIEIRAEAQVRELRWNAPVDVAVTVAGAGAWLAATFASSPSACRWCDENDVDGAARKVMKWSHPRSADVASDATGFLVAPLVLTADTLAASKEGAARGIPLDALLVTEATVLAVDVCLLTKFLVLRRRPNGSDNLSFFSGHTTTAFALASASGTVATLRGYRSAALTWVVGGTAAALTGYLRIAADAHWLTDVILGAIVGAGVGFAVPYAFHRSVSEEPGARTATVSSPLFLQSW
jgi:membrane-associated phospholipid phosphatase